MKEARLGEPAGISAPNLEGGKPQQNLRGYSRATRIENISHSNLASADYIAPKWS
jgi:hypothetical protein